MKIRCCGLVLLTLTSSCARAPGTRSPGAGQPSAAVRGARLADSLLERMTLAEKLGQLTMAPAQWGQTGPQAAGGGEDLVREGRIGSFLGFWGAAATRRMQRIAVEDSRLHIPLLFAYDVIHGWRTIFPVPLAEAASFDTAAVEGAGAAPTLPLRKDLRSIAMIGPLADDARSALGSWAAAGKPEDAITLLEGIRQAVPGTRVLHTRGTPVDTVDTRGFGEAERMAREADAVLLVLGEREDMSAEAASRASVELPGSQQALAQAVTRAARSSGPGKPVVAVLMNGRPLAVPWLADSVPAIVEAWFLGVEHGHAVADVLFGDHNPAGRLPVSLPRLTGQVSIYYSQKPTGRPPVVTEKYTSKYLDVPWTPQWPFGHGLSYTSFAYADLRLSADSVRAADSLVVRVSVRNRGSRAGDEVVQLYLRDDAASVTRPLRALKGFARVSLGPGAARDVRFTLRPEQLSLYDRTMRRVVEPGRFTVFVGGSSEGGLEGHFRVVGDTLVLAPPPPRMR